MTKSTEPNRYDLLFQGHTDGTASVTCLTIPGREPVPIQFVTGDEIVISVIGPIQPPPGAAHHHHREPMESAEVTFNVQYGPVSPLDDAGGRHYHWYAGMHAAYPLDFVGAWTFGAVLHAKDGTTYTLPDPEFQVGDGASLPD